MPVSTPSLDDNASVHRHSRPRQPNLLYDPDEYSEPDDEQPPPYSRFDPLLPPTPPQLPPRPQRQQDAYRDRPNERFQPLRVNALQQPDARRPPNLNTPRQSPLSPFPATLSSPAGFHAIPPQRNQPSSRASNAPFQYPPGYICPKCQNTGFKCYNSSPCGTCARLFGRQTADVRVVPSGWAAIPPPNAFVLKAGDPRLGGVLCGNCKGTGRVITLIFDSNCPICRGVGRII